METGLLNNPTQFYRSKDLDNSSLNYLNLYLEIIPYGIRASVFGAEKGEILAFFEKAGLISPLNDYENSFREILKSFDLKSSHFSKVSCVINSDQVVFVPDALYDQKGLKEMFQLNFSGKDIQEIVDYKCKTLDSHIIFDIPSKLVGDAIKVFPNAKFYHPSTVLVEKCMSEELTGSEKKAFGILYLNQEDLTLLVKRDNKLMFHNLFKVKAPEDVLYYLTYSLKEIGVDLEELDILVAGTFSADKELKELFKTYIPSYSFWGDKVVLPAELGKNPRSAFINLHLHLCE